MIRKLLRDYTLTGKNIRLKDMKRDDIPLVIGEVLLSPLYLQIELLIDVIMGGRKVGGIKEFVLVLGFFFIWVSQIKHPIKLGRMYYLCPMDAGERRVYLRNSFVFQGCLHSLAVMITCLILYFLCRVNIFAILYIILAGIMYGFLGNVRDRKKDLIRAIIIKPALFLTAYFIQFAIPSAGLGKGDYFFIACSFAFLLLVELPLFLLIIKAVRDDIMNISSCEEDLYKC